MNRKDFELTHEQIKACDAIERAISKAQKLGVAIFAKSETLTAYSQKAWDLDLVAPLHLPGDLNNPVPSRSIVSINGAGADDQEYFKL